MKVDSHIPPHKYEGNPMVNPDRAKVNGRTILGWAVLRVSGTDAVRKWVELFKPGRLEPSHEAVPLVDGRVLPPIGPAPPMPPAAPPVAPTAASPGIVQLRIACNTNKNLGNKSIDIDFVLKCINPPT